MLGCHTVFGRYLVAGFDWCFDGIVYMGKEGVSGGMGMDLYNHGYNFSSRNQKRILLQLFIHSLYSKFQIQKRV